jgi:hypothetical protein
MDTIIVNSFLQQLVIALLSWRHDKKFHVDRKSPKELTESADY